MFIVKSEGEVGQEKKKCEAAEAAFQMEGLHMWKL